MRRLLTATLALAYLGGAFGFYLPGLAPEDYTRHSPVSVAVNALTALSGGGQDEGVRSLLPYNYYDPRLGLCVPPGGPVAKSESLGSILFGDRIYSSPLNLTMLQDESCHIMCQVPYLDGDKVRFLSDRIREQYALNWLVDGLPAARKKRDSRTDEIFYSRGIELGRVLPLEQGGEEVDGGEGQALLHNHYDIHVQYHTVDEHHFRVVGVLVWPYSRKTTVDAVTGKADCSGKEPVILPENGEGTSDVVYTYNVHWEASEVPWGTRWDNYLHVVDSKVHWFSLVNSFAVVLILSVMVGMILVRALHKDISRYNADDESQEELAEEFGWKLVHGDVFRGPGHAMILSVCVGNGSQLMGMCGVTLLFAVLGFLSPSNRGSLVTAIVVFYMLFGGLAGYISSRTYSMLMATNRAAPGGDARGWRVNVLLTALFFPGMVFSLLIFLNLFLLSAHSAGAVPFGTLFAMTALWFLVSTPLTYIGAIMASRAPTIEPPVRTNQIPRQIPTQPMYLRLGPTIALAGILPFGAIFIELYFILSSIWSQKVYYVFGFLFLVSVILTLTVGEVSILLCYFQLCAENYRWWWRSFLAGGSVGVYVFGYSILYYYTRLDLTDFSSKVLYFGWMGIISLMVFLATGKCNKERGWEGYTSPY